MRLGPWVKHKVIPPEKKTTANERVNKIKYPIVTPPKLTLHKIDSGIKHFRNEGIKKPIWHWQEGQHTKRLEQSWTFVHLTPRLWLHKTKLKEDQSRNTSVVDQDSSLLFWEATRSRWDWGWGWGRQRSWQPHLRSSLPNSVLLLTLHAVR